MNLINQLNQLGKDVAGMYESVNWGGCGVFAAKIASRLEKHAEKVRIRVGNDKHEYHKGQDVAAVRPKLQSNTVYQWNKHDIHFAHVIVEFKYKGKKYHYDTFGAKPAKEVTFMGEYPLVAGGLTHQEMAELTATGRGWNPLFNRNIIPHIHKMIDDAFDVVDKRHKVVDTPHYQRFVEKHNARRLRTGNR
jgi:hypothetical protein